MAFGRLLGALVGDLMRGDVSGGFQRLVSSAQYEASYAAQSATQQAVDARLSRAGSAPAEPEMMADSSAWLLVQAMIASAGADGSIDAEELGRIRGKAAEAGLGPDQMAALEAELAAPKTAEAIAALCTDRAMAPLVYRLSLQAITVDTEEERSHLRRLSAALALPAASVAAIHTEAGVAPL